MNNVDKLIITRSNCTTQGLTYKYIKSTGEVITPNDTYSDLHAIDIGTIIREFMSTFIILSPYSNSHILHDSLFTDKLSFTVWNYNSDTFIHIIIDYRLNDSEIRYLLKKHNRSINRYYHNNSLNKPFLYPPLGHSAYMFNIDVKTCILEHKRFLIDWVNTDDIRYISIQAKYNPTESAMYHMGELVTQYLTKETIVHYHNIGTLDSVLARFLNIAIKLTTLELEKDRWCYVTHSLHKEQPRITDSNTVIDLDNYRMLPMKMKLVDGKMVEDETPHTDEVDKVTEMLSKAYKEGNK